MSSCTGHVARETVFRQMLAVRLGNGAEYRALESDMTGLNVKGNLYLYLPRILGILIVAIDTVGDGVSMVARGSLWLVTVKLKVIFPYSHRWMSAYN